MVWHGSRALSSIFLRTFAQLSQYPAALGYRMPAEWEPHAATWIAWPHNREDWPDKFEPIPWVYAEIVRHLSREERVNILVADEESEAAAREVLVRAHVMPGKSAKPGTRVGNISFVRLPTNRVWTRDSGPIFVRRSRTRDDGLPTVAATAWRFNAWAKYDDWQLDAPLSSEIAARLRLPAWKPIVACGWRAAPRGAGRRQHRRERSRHPADHGRVPAQRHPAAQPGRSHANSLNSVSPIILA